MYRTSELRISEAAAEIPGLSADKVHQLSNEKRIDVVSRIEILQTLTGHRWVGEASHDTSTAKPTAPTNEQKIAQHLLEQMGLASRFDWIERSGTYFSWVQFAINQPMLDMFIDKKHPFSVIEEGAAYGYPVSSTLAFAGVIPKKLVRQKSVAEYHMFGINSEKYYEREVECAVKMWDYLCEVAPELTAEAYKEYKEVTKNITTTPQA